MIARWREAQPGDLVVPVKLLRIVVATHGFNVCTALCQAERSSPQVADMSLFGDDVICAGSDE